MEKVKLHIDILDKTLGGGIPRNNLVLLYGTPGTGKTTIGMQFLINGVKFDNECGLYLTVSENELKLIKNFNEFKFFDSKVVEEGDVEIVDLRYASSQKKNRKNKYLFFDTLDMFSFLEEKVKEKNIKRIVIDSITALQSFIEDQAAFRDFIFSLSNLIYQLDCTVLMIDEAMSSENVNSVTHFMCDGIIRLNQVERNNLLTKTLEVVKMRGSQHLSDKMRLDITRDGVKLFPLIKDK